MLNINLNTEIGQIPLPSNAVIPDGPFTAEDLKRAIDSHYMFVVANVKVNTSIIMFDFALIINLPPITADRGEMHS